jgi:hypothetical protein
MAFIEKSNLNHSEIAKQNFNFIELHLVRNGRVSETQVDNVLTALLNSIRKDLLEDSQ